MLFCLVPRPNYSARSKRFRSCGPSKDVRPTQKFSKVRQRRSQGLPAFQYGGAILESEKTRPFFRWPDFGVLERDCMDRVRPLLSMRGMFLRYSLEPRPNRRVLATAVLVMTVGLAINGCSH